MLRNFRGRALVIASVLFMSVGATPQDTIVRPPKFDYTMTTLSNGLQVVFLEDHSTPIVHLSVWYHVGSKDERPGRTGFAHLFEHLMFQGSANVSKASTGSARSSSEARCRSRAARTRS